MGFLSTVSRLAGRDPYLENKLYVDSAMQHQRHQINELYNAPKEEQRAAERAAAEYRRQQEAAVKEQRGVLAEREKAAWRDWAAAPRYTGGNGHSDPLTVTHHRAGKVPVAVLPPTGVGEPPLVNGARATLHANMDLKTDERFMAKAKIADAAWPDVRSRYGSLLIALRDDDWWAQVCAPTATGTPSVAITSVSEHPWAGEYAAGREKITTHDLPTVAGLKVAGDGLRIRIAPRVGDNAARWKKAIEHLRAAFKSVGAPAGAMTIGEDSSGAIVIRLNDRDPLEDAVPVTGQWDDERFRSLLGVTADGREAWIRWGNSSGCIVGGEPGSGKTGSLLPVFEGMADRAELMVFDGKAQRDLHPLRHIASVYDRTGDLSAPLETLRELERLRVLRGDALYESIGAPNFWNVGKADRDRIGIKPIFCILDEAQTWLDPTGAVDKAQKAVQSEIAMLVRTLVQKGRSAGIVMVLTTQKPTADSIPTIIRDNASVRIAFKVNADEATKAILGSITDPNPAAIPPGKPGRFVMAVEGQGIVLGQAGYAHPDDLEARLKDAHPVEDQATVAARLAGKAPAPEAEPEPEPAAPAPEAPAPASAPPPVDGLMSELSAAELAAIASLLAKMRGATSEQAAAAPEPVAEADEPEAPAPEQAPPVMTKPATAPKPPAVAKVNDTPAF